MKHLKTFENFISEAKTNIGPNAKKFMDEIDHTELFIDAVRLGDDNDDPLPQEYHDAQKRLGVRPEETMIAYGQPSWHLVLRAAKSSNINYVEFTDKEQGESCLVFDITK